MTANSQTYNIVQIGEQVWMAKNLVNSTNASTCQKEEYGCYYTWRQAMNNSPSTTDNPSTVQGVCPTGWHLPSEAEWTSLTNTVLTNTVGESSTAGTQLKANSALWNDDMPPTTGAGTDTWGFSALPGGSHIVNTFNNPGVYGCWWSASEVNGTEAWCYRMHRSDAGANLTKNEKTTEYNVRCVKN
jgi:uncharacterized protein (TIGR02145 family)